MPNTRNAGRKPKDRRHFVKSQAIMSGVHLNDWAVEVIAYDICRQLDIPCVAQRQCQLVGVVTGTSKRKVTKEDRKVMENLYSDKYLHTLHIDNDVVMIDNTVKEFREFSLSDDGAWSKEVMDIIKVINEVKEA